MKSDIEKKFVPFKIAVELKDLGFTEPCIAVWYKSSLDGYTLQLNPLKLDDIYNIEPLSTFCNSLTKFDLMDSIIEYNFNKFFDEVDGEGNEFDIVYSAPLWQDVIDWFRVKYDVHIAITSYMNQPKDINEVFYEVSISTKENLYNGIIDNAVKRIGIELKGKKLSEFNLYSTYKKARKKAIIKSIKFVKSNRLN